MSALPPIATAKADIDPAGDEQTAKRHIVISIGMGIAVSGIDESVLWLVILLS